MIPYQLASNLGAILLSNNLKIVTAESCTGGWLSQAITAVPGSSAWFLQGWVTYSNDSKIKELNVEKELITKFGAVSRQIVTAMAQGALKKSGADIAIATSGVAGPDGGTIVNPVGTVWLAVAIKNQEVYTSCLKLEGDRESVRQQTVELGLQKIIELIKNI